MEHGEVLMEHGDSGVPFFVFVSGEIEIVRAADAYRKGTRLACDLNHTPLKYRTALAFL
jgi:hypothetical protein